MFFVVCFPLTCAQIVKMTLNTDSHGHESDNTWPVDVRDQLLFGRVLIFFVFFFVALDYQPAAVCVGTTSCLFLLSPQIDFY